MASAAWQVLLMRPGVAVSAEGVRVTGLLGAELIPVADVEGFGVRIKRAPLDQLDRAVVLVIHLTNGDERICKWVAWQDFASALMTAERPLPSRSQQRVLDRLGKALT